MISRRGLLFLIALFCYLTGQSSVISGTEPDYAGETLLFYTYTDPVSKSVRELFRIKIDDKGLFTSTTDNNEVVFAYSDFGVYRGLLFISPGKTITIHLPPRRDKTIAEQKNPYFSSFSTWLRTKEPGDNLNRMVSAFDARFNQLSDKYFNQLYVRQSKAYFDTVISAVTKEFGHINNQVFINHSKLKLKLLEGDVFRENREKIFEGVKFTAPSLWLHPAFMEILDPVFTNRLSFESRSIKGESVKKAVANRDLPFLKRFCEEKYRLSEPLTSIVLLKMCYDAFYSGDFQKELIISLVSLPEFTNHPNVNLRQFSNSVLRKMKFLLPGTKAPVICLNNVSGVEICSDKIVKKYLYLIFADIDIPVCREQLKYLAKIYRNLQPSMDLLVVLLPSGIEKINQFITEFQIPGTLVIDEPLLKISKLYDIKSYPTALLLNKNHESVLAPAKTPLDGFEPQFMSLIQAERINQMRQSRK